MIVLIETFENEINYVDGKYGRPVKCVQLEYPENSMLLIGEVISCIGQCEDFRVSFIDE